MSDLKRDGVKPKSKLLIPHRVAIALMDDGWILRNDIVWYKINNMPESVTDRFSKKFENIFLFVKQGRYFFDLDAVRERQTEQWIKRTKRNVMRPTPKREKNNVFGKGEITSKLYKADKRGKNPGDVWSISTQPSPFAHYAVWSEKLVERMVRCSTKPGDVVLDPFCGSGTTLMVADRLNRKGVGMDLGYREIQEQRLAGIQREMAL